MDQSIRKIFNQLKKTKEISKNRIKYLSNFEEYWDGLESMDKVNLYCNWNRLINCSLEMERKS
jgi:hypothetical protein